MYNYNQRTPPPRGKNRHVIGDPATVLRFKAFFVEIHFDTCITHKFVMRTDSQITYHKVFLVRFKNHLPLFEKYSSKCVIFN